MRNSGPFSAEDESPPELRRAIAGFLVMLLAVALLVTTLISALPIGPSPRTGILAWLLVLLAFYWLYAGMGYWPLLIVQLVLFSVAATLLTTKTALTVLEVHRFPILRHTGSALIGLGAGCAAANLGFMLWTLLTKSRARQRGGSA